MNTVSDTQQKSLILGVVLIGLVISLDLLLPNNDIEGKIILWSIVSIIFGILISYSFVINPSYSRREFSRFPRIHSRNNGFKPRIIPPAAVKKKTQLKGVCDYCGESSSLGFTCSYCGRFYCANHRIPEKHNCSGLHNR